MRQSCCWIAYADASKVDVMHLVNMKGTQMFWISRFFWQKNVRSDDDKLLRPLNNIHNENRTTHPIARIGRLPGYDSLCKNQALA